MGEVVQQLNGSRGRPGWLARKAKPAVSSAKQPAAPPERFSKLDYAAATRMTVPRKEKRAAHRWKDAVDSCPTKSRSVLDLFSLQSIHPSLESWCGGGGCYLVSVTVVSRRCCVDART